MNLHIDADDDVGWSGRLEITRGSPFANGSALGRSLKSQSRRRRLHLPVVKLAWLGECQKICVS